MDPVAIVTNEIVTISSAMRKHWRWAFSGAASVLGGAGDLPGQGGEDEGLMSVVRRGGSSGGNSRANSNNAALNNHKSAEQTLVADLHRLRLALGERTTLDGFDTPTLIQPFLGLIRLRTVPGTITALALGTIDKLFAYGIITLESPRLALALQLLASGTTNCRFEAAETAQDEVVLLRILKVMEMIMTSPFNELLGDEGVCQIMETGLSMCCQTRLSELLRRAAEMAMLNMVRTIFVRFKTLDIEVEPETVLDATPSSPSQEPLIMTVETGHPSDAFDVPAQTQLSQEEVIAHVADTPVHPHSIASVRELLRVLITLLDPNNNRHTDTMRNIALRILDVAFEIAGTEIGKQPTLRRLVTDDLCRYLFRLITSDSPLILANSLHVTNTLLHTLRPYLKLQVELCLEYMFSCLQIPVSPSEGHALPSHHQMDDIFYQGVPAGVKGSKAAPDSSGRSTPLPIKERQRLGMDGGAGMRSAESKEAMVESIGGLVRIPTFMVDLFINYDCEVDRADLCEDMIGFLARNAFADAAAWTTAYVPPLCLNALLAYVGLLHDRLDYAKAQAVGSDYYFEPQRLKERRKRKAVVIRGANKFNENPRDGLAYLAENGILDDEASPASVARFFRGTSRINKRLLGEYLSKSANKATLDAFFGFV